MTDQGPLLGITTTIPLEVALAGGWRVVDINNRFITDPDPGRLVLRAEEMGLPRTLCAWIKGLYAWLMEHPEVNRVVGVTRGDCSNTHALLELLRLAGRQVMAFDYPAEPSPQAMQGALASLADTLGADLDRAESIRQGLSLVRADLARLDEMTWRTGQVSGAENHLWLVSASDFDGDDTDFRQRLKSFLTRAEARPIRQSGPRLGVLGVPPIITGLHETLDEMGAWVAYNEVQRQFAMLDEPHRGPGLLAAQYSAYTYPYDVFGRIADIDRQARLRHLDGLIHYTQTFCYRQVQDVALRQRLDMPILTLEGNQPGPVDGRTRLRLEAFLEMLG